MIVAEIVGIHPREMHVGVVLSQAGDGARIVDGMGVNLTRKKMKVGQQASSIVDREIWIERINGGSERQEGIEGLGRVRSVM